MASPSSTDTSNRYDVTIGGYLCHEKEERSQKNLARGAYERMQRELAKVKTERDI